MKLDKKLNKKSKNELIVLAKKLNIKGYSSLNKNELIQKMVTEKEEEIQKILYNSFWKRHNHHIYGWASVIGLLVAILTFSFPYLKKQFQKDIPIENGKIIIAGKNFLESSILLELMAVI